MDCCVCEEFVAIVVEVIFSITASCILLPKHTERENLSQFDSEVSSKVRSRVHGLRLTPGQGEGIPVTREHW
jgi:hypothetical protein